MRKLTRNMTPCPPSRAMRLTVCRTCKQTGRVRLDTCRSLKTTHERGVDVQVGPTSSWNFSSNFGAGVAFFTGGVVDLRRRGFGVSAAVSGVELLLVNAQERRRRSIS